MERPRVTPPHEASNCPKCGHELDLPPPVKLGSFSTMTVLTELSEAKVSAPAFKRERSREASAKRKWDHTSAAADILAKNSTFESPMTFLARLSEEAGVSVLLAKRVYTHKNGRFDRETGSVKFNAG